jgi:hypothetical protein
MDGVADRLRTERAVDEEVGDGGLASLRKNVEDGAAHADRGERRRDRPSQAVQGLAANVFSLLQIAT